MRRIPDAPPRGKAITVDLEGETLAAVEGEPVACSLIAAGEAVTNAALSSRLEVSPSSASGMVAKLARQGLVEHVPYRGIELTSEGRLLARSVLPRHRLIETFLVSELGYTWDEVHAEADLLEHVVSDLLIERMARHDIYFLCFPIDLDLMVGFVGGDFAWELSAEGEAAGVDFVVDRLCGIFGGDVRKHVGRATMTNWGGERFVRGGYAAARPGRSQARATLTEPVAEKIFFAGEHVAGPLIQTCGGARLSGESVARQVVAQLSGK